MDDSFSRSRCAGRDGDVVQVNANKKNENRIKKNLTG
jgi:hypothetical protein